MPRDQCCEFRVDDAKWTLELMRSNVFDLLSQILKMNAKHQGQLPAPNAQTRHASKTRPWGIENLTA